jgi:hypothetical protein
MAAMLGAFRWQLVPAFAFTVILDIYVIVSKDAGVAAGVLGLILLPISFLLCALLPQLLPQKPRGKYDVACVLDHIKTPVAANAAAAAVPNSEPRPLELMAAVFYPVDKRAVAAAPFFPRFRLQRAATLLQRLSWLSSLPLRHSLQVLVVAAAVAAVCSASDGGSWSSWWYGLWIAAFCAVCFLSDVAELRNRSTLGLQYATHAECAAVARFAGLPGFLWSHVPYMRSPSYDGAYMYRDGSAVFPVAAAPAGGWPVVLFFHGKHLATFSITVLQLLLVRAELYAEAVIQCLCNDA